MKDSLNRMDLTEDDPGIDSQWVKRWERGRALMLVYVVLGTLVVSVGAASGFGPFAWLASAQAKLLGVASPILSAIVAYGLLALPIVLLLRRSSDRTTPWLLGAQQAFDTTRRPRFVGSPQRRLSGARTAFKCSLAAAGVALLVGAAGWFTSQRPAQDAGRPLPVLTLAQAVAAPDPLPKFVRLVEAADQPGAAWLYDHHIRQTFYRDAYFPLTAPGWRRGDPVAVLELDRLLPDDAPTRLNVLDPAAPREGALSRSKLEPWQMEAMRRAGLQLAPQPLVLERRPLGGRVPGPDWVTGFVWLDIAFAAAFVSALLAWRFSRAVAQLRSEDIAKLGNPAVRRPHRHP